MMWKYFCTRGQLKKKSNQRHICEFTELDGGGGYFEKIKLRGCKSNRNFYRDENRKWRILQGWKTLLTFDVQTQWAIFLNGYKSFKAYLPSKPIHLVKDSYNLECLNWFNACQLLLDQAMEGCQFVTYPS